MGKLIELDSRRKPSARQTVRERIETSDIQEEMRHNAQTPQFDGRHTVNEDYLADTPRPIKELYRFLKTLSKCEQLRIKHLIENVTLDARVRDHAFTCTMVYLRTNTDLQIPPLYHKIRAALHVNIGVLLPDLPMIENAPSKP